jgi:hypothetical protein
MCEGPGGLILSKNQVFQRVRYTRKDKYLSRLPMSRNFSIASLTHHASERVFQRSRLTASEVSAMLEKKHFYWAETPKVGKSCFALVFDALAQQYVVAVVAPYDRNIKTLLTLEQFEETYHPVSHAAKLLARLAIFAGEGPQTTVPNPVDTEPTKVELAIKVEAPFVWRFVVTRQDAVDVGLPVLSHAEICERLLFVFPAQDARDLKRRSVRVIQTKAFLEWFVGALSDAGVPADEVCGLRVEALGEEAIRFSADLTQPFVKVLSEENASSLNGEARRAGRHARKAFRQRQTQQQNPDAVQKVSRKTYAVDLMSV